MIKLFNKLVNKIDEWLRSYNIKLSDTTISMVLGAIVVVVASLIAYNYFQNQRRESPKATTEEILPEQQGELTEPTMSVTLPTVHTVAAGENLWVVAEKYFSSGYNSIDIARQNTLVNPNIITVGQKLTIPKVEPRRPPTITTVKPSVTAPRIEGKTYTVTKSDNLWTIAVRAYGDGYRWTEIARINKLANPNIIHPGNNLTLLR